MRVVIKTEHSRRIFAIVNLDEHTTLSDILNAARLDQRDWEAGLWVDGIKYDLTTKCRQAYLLDGSLISNHAPTSTSTGSWALATIGGENTGALFSLPVEGAMRIGRSDQAEITLSSPSVSWSHAILTINSQGIWISDDSSSNGTWINGECLKAASEPVLLKENDIISLGGICLKLITAKAAHSPVYSNYRLGIGQVAFNRPPRAALPPLPQPLELPVKSEAEKPTKFSWITFVAPLLMAAAMVTVMGSARYALIALLSPVMALGSWWEQKRRARSSKEESEQSYREALEKLQQDLDNSVIQQRQHLSAKTAYPHEHIDTVHSGGMKLWQVRRNDHDFWQASLGTATRNWEIPLEKQGKPEESVQQILDSSLLKSAPVNVDFNAGPVGIWGNREHALAIARSLLCQSVTRSGPADMTTVVLADAKNAKEWEWTAWTPHTMMGGANPNNRWIAMTTDNAQSMARTLRDNIEDLPIHRAMLIVDNLSLLEGRDAPTRELLEYSPTPQYGQENKQVSAIVIAPQAAQLPSSCHTVIEAKTDSEACLHIPSSNTTISEVTTCQISLQTAEEWMQALARFEDPEIKTPGGGLPTLVHLFDLLELDRNDLSAKDIKEFWANKKDFSAPLGICADGTFYFDLIKDGPHGLVGGTTGSGKSELLRSLVAGLAARISPEELTFILVDFKGGAAFASLDQLPHTIGTLSNLESSLAYRALRALEAEMRYRQECFAAAGEGIDNLDAYLATNPEKPLPRLLVVVDEFAQLAKEYPDVLSALVSIGAVGRTLGVHMILATQRPAGVVNDDILANTNMRTALRVQSREDSNNVISVPDAANIGREQKGRAYIKLGENDITPIQTALVTGISGQKNSTDLHVDEISVGQAPPEHKLANQKHLNSDMEELIEVIKQAAIEKGYSTPRPVWPEPLGETILLDLGYSANTITSTPVISLNNKTENYATTETEIPMALADDPDHQRQYHTGWQLSEGNLLLAGIPGSGTTSALISIALSLAATHSPEDTDFLFLDLDSKGLESIAKLPHARGYAGAGNINRELQTRLLRYLIEELDRRTSNAGSYPDLFVFIDGFASLREEYDDYEGLELLQAFYQVWAKGPGVGIYFAAATTRIKSIPSAIDEVTPQKWLFHLADPYDYSVAGISKDNIPAHLPGRYINTLNTHHAHVAIPDNLEQAIVELSSRWHSVSKPTVIAALPTKVAPKQISDLAQLGTEPWNIPVGLAEHNLRPYVLQAWAGEHMLISGPARSGKSSALLGIASALALAAANTNQPLKIYGTGSRRSPLLNSDLGNFVTHDQAGMVFSEALDPDTPTLILVDDAHLFTDTELHLTSLLNMPNPKVLIIAAGRNDDLRSQYGQWSNQLRKSHLGLLLQPDKNYDGELLGTTLPRSDSVKMSIGRGYACQNGTAVLVQSVGASS